MNQFLESAKEILRAEPCENKIFFMGAPIEEFDKEYLIRIVHWSLVANQRMRKNMEQEREMAHVFSEARRR